MFDKIKDLYNLKQQAQQLQAQLADKKVTGISRNGHLKVTLNGSNEILTVEVSEDTEFNKSSLEKSIKEAFGDAQAKLKSLLMTSFKDLM